MKDFFKKKRQKQVPEPRSMDEIQKEYKELLSKAGNAQYLVYVYSKELEQVNARLLSVNQEAGVRQELDRKAPEQQDGEKNVES